MNGSAVTLGIDLAAQPENTAACRVEWQCDVPTVSVVTLGDGCADEPLIAMIAGVVRGGGTVAIDAPFGWPDAFVEQLVEYRERGRWSAAEARAGLCWRATDALLKAEKIHPLSVSTDRIGVVAMRCAHLLTRLAAEGIARDPLGRQVVEVYPGGALRRWGLDTKGYKQSADARARLMRQSPLASVKVDVDVQPRLVATDHAFDALVSALVARDVARGRADEPRPPMDLAQLGREGWIWMPRRKAALDESA
jgi:hypothetical protein